MRIEISDGFGDEDKIILTNESLDNYNFVDIISKDNEITVSVDELMSAAISFDHLRNKNDTRFKHREVDN